MRMRMRSDRERRAMWARMKGKAQSPAEARRSMETFISGLRKKATQMDTMAGRSRKKGFRKTAVAMKGVASADRRLAEALERETLGK